MSRAADHSLLAAAAKGENTLLSLALAAMALLPLAEMGLRATLKVGIPGATSLTQHLTLVVGMIGAAVAAREGRLLAISGLQALLPAPAAALALRT